MLPGEARHEFAQLLARQLRRVLLVEPLPPSASQGRGQVSAIDQYA
jgi:hypothetical protein